MCVCPLPPTNPSRVTFGGSYTATKTKKKKKSEKKRQTATTIKTNNAKYARNKTDERKRRKVMTTLSDMVMQCGGGGCCVLEQCFQYPRRAREPRDCGCQFALLHRADIAWPSVHVLKSQFYLLVALPIHAGEKPRLYRGSHPVFLLLSLFHPHTHLFLLCLCDLPYLSVCISSCLTFEPPTRSTLSFSFRRRTGKLKAYLSSH